MIMDTEREADHACGESMHSESQKGGGECVRREREEWECEWTGEVSGERQGERFAAKPSESRRGRRASFENCFEPDLRRRRF